jgi:squalene monooxygenase
VCVIGGGPVGSATAIAFARRGASVLVLEKDPRASRRFAGEWIHPAGVEVLDALRAGRLEGANPCVGYGFVIFPSDGSPPIELPYPDGVALSAPHESIVSALRDASLGVSGVELVSMAQVVSVDDHRVIAVKRPEGHSLEISADRIVGADGRSSLVRRQLGFDDNSSALSYMASVDLDDLVLPCEGFGHVVLGGPGPVLLYRVSERLVRGCFDVPVQYGSANRTPAFLWESFRYVLPEAMLCSFQRGLESRTLRWAATRFRPRTHFGRGPAALVGDAVGHVHPMTAIGLSMGFLDAQSVAANAGLEGYVKERRGYVPELLSNALYHCFRRDDASARKMRDAMFQSLRSNPDKRRQTMKILSAQDQRTTSFGRVFVHVAAGAVQRTVAEAKRAGGLRSVPGALSAFGEWIQWPAAALVPRLVRETYRARSTATHPIPFLRAWVPASDEPEPEKVLVREGGASLDGRGSSKRLHVSPPRVNDAIGKVTEILLTELEALGAKIGNTPDEVLAIPGLRMMRAITATHMRSGVAARMTIGRRWLARNSVPRLLEAAETRGAFATLDLAALLVILLDGAGGGKVEVVDLEEGVEALLRLQTRGGGFALRVSGIAPGEAGDVRTTALCCQALMAVERLFLLRDQRLLDMGRLKKAVGLAVRWLMENVTPDVPSGSADEGERLARTVWVLEVLASVRDETTSPWTSRASQRLASLLASSVSMSGATHEPTQALMIAMALRGLLLASPSGLNSTATAGAGAVDGGSREESHRASMEAATRWLADSVLTSRAFSDDPSTGGHVGWETCSEVLLTLALCETVQRRGEVPASSHAGRAAPSSSAHVAQPVPRAKREVAKRDTAQADWSFCRERLAEVSRSFSKPIALLPPHLEVAVTLAYLLCRVADSIEDHVAVPQASRAPLMSRFIDVLHGREDPEVFSGAFAREIGVAALETDPELVLTTNMPVVMRVFDLQPDATRATLVRWITEMARGMALYTFRQPGSDGIVALETVSDLERYCYFVAGTVGHLLTDLFLEELGDEVTPDLALTLRVHAEQFGMGLQLVNVLKDLTEDQARRWSYIPRTICAARGLGIRDLRDPSERASAHAALAPLFDIAKKKLDDGMLYTLAIPPRHAGIRRFCLLPLWMAARTLVLAQGNDAMFTPGEPVKIPREEVAALSVACVAHSGDDEVLRARYAGLWTSEVPADRRSAS